jgi:hypothetical protein
VVLRRAAVLAFALLTIAEAAESQSRRSRGARLRNAYRDSVAAESLRAVRDSVARAGERSSKSAWDDTLRAVRAQIMNRARSRRPTDSDSTRFTQVARRSSGDVVTTADFSAPAAESSITPLRARSAASQRTRTLAAKDRDLRIVISIDDRELWVVLGADTLLTAPVAVSMDESMTYAGRTWRFETPSGLRRVIGKKGNPVWTPPDWHYAEVARRHSLKLAPMKAGRTILGDGNWLEVRDSVIGLVDKYDREYEPLPLDEEIVFDGTLFIPPMGTLNRRIEGELGLHALDLGSGYLLHGTPYKASIGTAVTHGCIRLHDEDIEWLHDMIPVGAKVYIY